jgi:hypothetical protein
MLPLDPGRNWLASGITGLARQREWDAVATTEAPGSEGDEAEFVVLPDGRILVESPEHGFDAAPLAAALEGEIEPPYRAFAVRRPELWAVGAVGIGVARLEPDPRSDDLELTWNGESLELVADGMPADPSSAAPLERIAAEREEGPYAAHAHRLDGDLFELLVLPL